MVSCGQRERANDKTGVRKERRVSESKTGRWKQLTEISVVMSSCYREIKRVKKEMVKKEMVKQRWRGAGRKFLRLKTAKCWCLNRKC